MAGVWSREERLRGIAVQVSGDGGAPTDAWVAAAVATGWWIAGRERADGPCTADAGCVVLGHVADADGTVFHLVADEAAGHATGAWCRTDVVPVEDLLRALATRRIAVSASGGELRYDGPSAVVDEEAVASLRLHKAALLAHLDPWFHVLASSDDGPVVVVVPAAAAGPADYRSWTPAAGGATVVVVNSPGHGRRLLEEPHHTVGPVADAVASGIESSFSGRRVVLFGHSAGALIAYEVAARLPTGAVALLAVAACPSPDRAVPTETSDAEKVAYLYELTGVAPGDIDDESLQLVATGLAADLDVANSCYRELTADAVLDVPIVGIHLVADDLLDVADVEAWGRWTAGGFRLLTMAGDHFTPMSDGAQILESIVMVTRGL